jgi:hypothetical protein
MTDVETWLAGQTANVREGVERLRALVRSVEAPWEETIKWNAPSFAIGGEDRVTLGVERKGGWRVVLHRGAAVRDDGFSFDDPDGLATWPTPDRGVVVVRDLAVLSAMEPALTDLIRRWVAATG